VNFTGVVLAGGRSKRFGSDKARFVYNHKTMMQWVLDSFELANERFIVANQPYDEFNVPVYADVISSHTPLSGIHSALVHAKHDWVAVAACDMPYLTTHYWQILQKYCHDTKAVVVESYFGLEPLAAFYHRSLIQAISIALDREQKAVHLFLESTAKTVIRAEELKLPNNTFLNINRLEDVPAS
jgi:molybdenum cofactor guanylyltransferase